MMSKLRNNILNFPISRYYQLHHQKQIYAKKNMSRLFYDYIKVRISHNLNNYRVKHPLEETTHGTNTILSSTSRNMFRLIRVCHQLVLFSLPPKLGLERMCQSS